MQPECSLAACNSAPKFRRHQGGEEKGLGGSAANRIHRSICLTRLPFLRCAPVLPTPHKMLSPPVSRTTDGCGNNEGCAVAQLQHRRRKKGVCSMHAEAAKSPSCLLEKRDHWLSAFSSRYLLHRSQESATFCSSTYSFRIKVKSSTRISCQPITK